MDSDNKKAETGGAKKSEPAAKEAAKSEPAAKEAAKSEPAVKDKTPAAESTTKAETGKAAAAPASYSRGEGQKPVTRAYKENWNAIFAKKSVKTTAEKRAKTKGATKKATKNAKKKKR